MPMPDKSMKRNVLALLDKDVSDLGEISLAIAINNFLVAPVAFDEALEIYASLMDMCNAGNDLVNMPLRSRLLSEMRDVPPVVMTEKMRKYSVSIRKIFADAVASTLCREYQKILTEIKGSVYSNSADDLLARANVTKPDKGEAYREFAFLPYPCRA
jgi:hypothetical protein